MAVEFKEMVDIAPETSFKIGGKVALFGALSSEADLPAALEEIERAGLPLTILGGGSNTVFADGILRRAVLKMEIEGFRIIEDTSNFSLVEIKAGENWDTVVSKAVEQGLAGIEAMSAIPGTAGATPVQNVGAYGQEIKDTLVELGAYDLKDKKMVTLSNKECDFKYRDSIFKRRARDRYIVTSLTLKLSKDEPSIPQYPGVEKYFTDRQITMPDLKTLREAITSIRATKLPDPRNISNAGSFFKNPIVSKDLADRLQKEHPTLPVYSIGQNECKISAAWLMDHLGLKGRNFGRIGVYEQNALVLVNRGQAMYGDLIEARDKIIQDILSHYGVRLEAEPIFIE